MQIRQLEADAQGRVTIGVEYADSEVTVAVSEGDEMDNWGTLSETILYLHTEILTGFASQMESTIEDSINGDVEIDCSQMQSDDTFTLTAAASPTAATKPEMQTVGEQITAVLKSHDQPVEQEYSKLDVTGATTGTMGVEKHQRILRYRVGPVDVSTLPSGYLTTYSERTASVTAESETV